MSSADGVASSGIFLPWDSEFFGFRIGRAQGSRLTTASREALLQWCGAERLRCLYFLADGEDGATLEQAHAGGFKFVDLRVDLTVEVARIAPVQSPAGFRPVREEEVPAIESIARRTHTDTRFFKDTGFPAARAADLYARWIQRDFREHHVFVVDGAESLAGYVTCQLEAARGVGRIGLIAVAEEARGRGYGRALVQGALAWFHAARCGEVRVATQGTNLAAQRLYQAFGFRTAEANVTFHRWF
jgi:dTDP-4-amino-4,6-dideoxy-D-galactose acyltransferase